ncbi:threonine ammonia-lyase [Terrirubrum flagellatum]|uniref:threonine ammonia-lyase n=1 Tax=Terrirubrum flagellatum TaxID=2895980 RepID=UPI003CC839D6
MSNKFAITIDDVRDAARILKGELARTPCLAAPKLSALTGADIVVKYETMHATGSFKERGAIVKLASLSAEERGRGVIAMSAGNHAQAVAYHAGRLGVPATIVMPDGTPLVKIENTRGYGARVILHGETLAESQTEARRIAAEEELVFVHPYDDARIMAGQGTIALEMLDEHPDLDALVIPLGGGGLGAGNAIAAKAVKPDIEIVGVEAESFASFDNAMHHRERPIGGATLAEGIAVKNVGALTLPVVQKLFSDIICVNETEIEDAINIFATYQRVMAEGAGATGLAAVLAQKERFARRKVGLILCGGNIDARMLASIMVRALERADRIVSFRVTTSDRPGILGKIATRVGELGANILEVSHGRLFIDVPAKGVSLDLTVETRDAAHARELLETLANEGYSPARLDPRGLGPVD